jgi:Tfp pilus assembly PilM family ATPase
MSIGVLKSGVSPIAVEFGGSSLKALQLAWGETPSVIAAAALDTPNELLENDEARLQFQLDNVGSLLRGAGFKGRRVVCTVSATRTFVQQLHVPRVEGMSTDHAIKIKLRELLERSSREIILKTIEVGELIRDGSKMVELLCIAMPRETVLGHMQSLRNAKLEIVGIFSEHIAAVRAFDLVTRRASDDRLTSLYVDLGYATTKVMITHGKELRFAKTIAIGGRDFDRVLSRLNSVPLSIARNQRCGLYAVAGSPPIGINSSANRIAGPSAAVASGESEPVTSDEAPPRTFEECLDDLPEGFCRTRVRLLSEELNRAIAYHGALFPSRRIARAVFFGGESRTRALPTALAVNAGVRGFVSNPLALIDGVESAACTNVCLETAQPAWAVPLGLCLSPTDL